jgi:S-adenosylmethionine:tRNA ribosyltransferase-isomerase
MDRKTGECVHRHFYEIQNLLRPGDLLVMNDSRVIPARLLGEKEGSGGAMEFLLLEQKGKDEWETLVRPGRKAKLGARFVFGGGLLKAEIAEVLPDGNRIARFEYQGDFFHVLDLVGQMPLPHYITEELKDKERYQTVYARENGSAAAPTAGLHFTRDLLAVLEAKGIGTAYVTLHVGLGTFRPVKAEEITDHHMHTERYFIPEETARKISDTKAAGGRVIAVGTTSCRTLESAAAAYGEIRPCSGATDIFIYPGFRFQVLDGLITNFHLPESTLIMLVSAFAGYEHTMAAYRLAVEEGYRFYSLGDAMFMI